MANNTQSHNRNQTAQGTSRRPVATARQTSDRQAPVKASDRQPKPPSDRQQGAGTQGQRGERPVRGAKPSGLSLKIKFMLIMAVITAVTMAGLGILLAVKSSNYLLGEKVHGGVEVAKTAAGLAQVLRVRVAEAKSRPGEAGDLKKKVEAEVDAVFKGIRLWGERDDLTDIEGIAINAPSIPEISRVWVGTDTGASFTGAVGQLFLPKSGETVGLPVGVTAQIGEKTTKSGGKVPIYRFKVALDKSLFGDDASMRVDVAAASINNAKSNLMTTIAIAVIVNIILVIGIAHLLASSITRPLELLVKDMAIVSRGNLGHQTKATSTDEVGLLAREFNKMSVSLQDAQASVVEQEKAAHELSIAREVQRQLLPAEAPSINGWQVDAFYQGAKAVSGDYYDFIPLGEDRWGFIIADVSGKGIPGSMVMAVTRTIVRLMATKHGENAAETLKDTNRLIAKQIKRGMFVTAFYAVLDLRTATLTYASAGHNPMVITRGAGRPPELASAKGIALGFNEGPIFDKTIQTNRVQIAPGDAFILYTDGFPEAMNAKNEEFGDDTFNALCAAAGQLDAKSATKAIVDGIAKHRGDAEQSDDLTLIVVKRS